MEGYTGQCLVSVFSFLHQYIALEGSVEKNQVTWVDSGFVSFPVSFPWSLRRSLIFPKQNFSCSLSQRLLIRKKPFFLNKWINRTKLDEYERNVSHYCSYQYANVHTLQYCCGNTAVLLWKQWHGLLKERWSTVKWLPEKEGSISLWVFLLKRTAENRNSDLIHITADFGGWTQGMITKLQPQHSRRRSWALQDGWKDKQKFYLYFNR